jgi:hypothetical protein
MVLEENPKRTHPFQTRKKSTREMVSDRRADMARVFVEPKF